MKINCFVGCLVEFFFKFSRLSNLCISCGKLRKISFGAKEDGRYSKALSAIVGCTRAMQASQM